RLLAAAGLAVPMIELGTNSDVNLEGFFIQGVATAGCKGIHGTTNAFLHLHRLGLNGHGSQAIQLLGGAGMIIDSIWASGMRVTSGLADYTGAVEIGGVDVQCS